MTATYTLTGVQVLDLSDGVGGQFCGKLFADQGARVRLVEPPSGSSTRTWTERSTTVRGTSALFRHLNGGKACLTGSDLAAGDDRMRRLAGQADVAIIDSGGKPPPWLADGNPNLIVCQITPFGATGCYSTWLGSEIVYQAFSGVMYQNGLPGREPLYGVAHRASCAAGTIAFIEAGALLLRGAGGATVDVSIAEVATSMNFNLITQYAYSGDIERRESRSTARTVLPCQDGWVAIFIRDRQWRDIAHALGFADLVDDPRFDTEPHRLAHWDEFEAEVGNRLRTWQADDVVMAGQAIRTAVARALTPLGLLSCPQLAAREFWEGGPEPYSAEIPAIRGARRRLGPMFRLTPPTGTGDMAPPGTDTAWRATSPWRARNGSSQQSAVLPLEGIRVLEISTAWAGPMAARLLGTLGADVVKIEGPSRFDDWRQGTRGGPEGRYPGRVHGARPYNRNCQFNTQNSNKRAIALDLKTERGRSVAFRLATVADVIICNFRSGWLDSIGLGWKQLAAVNPRLVLAEMSAYGDSGPLSHHVALGPSMEMMSGMATLVGYGDGKPVTTGPAYLDPIGAFNGAAAIISALVRRKVTGAGARIEMAQREAALHWIGEEITEAIDCGADRVPRGNRKAQACPHGAFPAKGVDQWVALSVETDAQARAIGKLIGVNLRSDKNFCSLDVRKAHEDDIERCVAAWTSRHDKFEAVDLLQAAGVPAAPVMAADDLFASKFLRNRGMLPEFEQPEAGTFIHQGLPLHISGLDLKVRNPAPRFGEHNREVLNEWLSLSADSVDELYADEIITDCPSAETPSR